MKWHTEKRKVKDLVPMEINPRTMSEKQDKDLEKSLDKFDLVEIPAINTDNVILAGHQRIRKLIEKGRGDEEIDVRVPDRKLSEKLVKEYNIKSNKNLGSWDFEILADEFEVPELEEAGWDRSELSFLETEEKPQSLSTIEPFKKTHILISIPTKDIVLINKFIDQIRNIKTAEIETGSN